MNLLELIEANKRGRSLRELAQDSGGLITSGNYFWSGRVAEFKAFPHADKIRGYATALEVPVRSIVLAIADSLGIADFDPSQDPAPDDGALPAAQARADRLQSELEAERDLVRYLKARVSRLQTDAKAKSRAPRRADADSESVAQLKERVAELQGRLERQQNAGKVDPSAEPLLVGIEAEYWREHALRYRQRLARYEGLRPLPRRHRNGR